MNFEKHYFESIKANLSKMRRLITFIFTAIFVLHLFGQNKNAGTIIYERKVDTVQKDTTIFLLLADHVKDKARGWSSLGGSFGKSDTSSLQTAILETYQESKAFYEKQFLVARIVSTNYVDVIENNYRAYLLEIDSIDINGLLIKKAPNDSSKYNERDHYVKVDLKIILKSIRNSYKSQTITIDTTGFNRPNAYTNYMFIPFVKSLELALQKEPFSKLAFVKSHFAQMEELKKNSSDSKKVSGGNDVDKKIDENWVSAKAQIKALNHRIEELEKVKNKRKISKTEITYPSFPKVKFDFDEPYKITIPKKIKQGEFYQIEITGINLNQYRLSIENSDTIFSTSIDFPTFGTLDLSTLTNLVNSLPVSTSSQENAEKVEETMELASLVEFDESMTLKANFSRVKSEVDPAIEKILKEMAALQASNKLKQLINTKISSIKVHSSEFNNDLKISNEAIENHQFRYTAYRILRQSGESAGTYKPNVRDDLTKFAEYRSTLKQLKHRIDTTSKSFNKFLDRGDVKVFLNDGKNIDVKENVDKAKKALAEATSKTTKVISLVSVSNVEKQLRSILNLYQENTYRSLPIQMNGEQAEVDIKFIPKDSASALQPYVLSTIRFPQRKWYWSVGPSIYYSNLSHQRLGTETILVDDTLTRFNVFQEADLEKEIGAALLLRAGYKLTDWGLGLHASVGTGLSLGDEVLPRMLYGIGVTFGQIHSISIDIGGISGYVKRISQNADYTREYIEKPSLIVNELQTKLFFGVGYAFRF